MEKVRPAHEKHKNGQFVKKDEKQNSRITWVISSISLSPPPPLPNPPLSTPLSFPLARYIAGKPRILSRSLRNTSLTLVGGWVGGSVDAKRKTVDARRVSA